VETERRRRSVVDCLSLSLFVRPLPAATATATAITTAIAMGTGAASFRFAKPSRGGDDGRPHLRQGHRQMQIWRPS